MIILTVEEHLFKAGMPFDCANSFFEKSDFNDLDVENKIIEINAIDFVFLNDVSVRFYSVNVKDPDGAADFSSEEQKQEYIQDALLIEAYLEDLSSDQDYWIECFADIPVGKHIVDLSFSPPVGEDAEVVFYGSKPYMGKTLLEWHEVQERLVTDENGKVISYK